MAVLNTTSPSPMTSAPRALPTKARPSSRASTACLLSAGNDHRLVDAVHLADEDLDALAFGGGDVLPHVVGTDRQLAMSTVDEHRELDRAGPAKVHERVHRRPRGAAVMDDVVDEDHDLAADVRQLARGSVPVVWAQVQVVAMLRHVETAERHGGLLQLFQGRRQPAREHVALADDADQDDVAHAAVPLHDLVRDAHQGAADLVRVHDGGLESDAHERMRSKRAMRTWRPLRACRK